MITINGVSKGFGGRTLFASVNCTFSPGRNYGLTGPNGCGKSTLMRILIGEEEPDSGRSTRPRRTGWLRQDHNTFDGHKVLDVVLMGNKRLWKAMEDKEEIYIRGEFTDEDNDQLGEHECVIAEEDGYSAYAEAAVLLTGLGITDELHEADLKHLQGGMKLRVLLAQALFGRPEALLLDEPTNHLDLDSIRWLETFLWSYDGVLVVISHDRRFLNEVCDHIADIDYEAIITYVGNYDEMVRTKSKIRGRLEKQTETRERKIEQLQEFIAKFKAGTRASQTKSRAKQVARLRPEEIKRSNIARPYIRFSVGDGSGREVLNIKDLSWAYGEYQIFSGLHCSFNRGDKVAILGRNGIGKTTLIKCLMGKLGVPEEAVHWGHQTKIGYFPQEQRDEIEPGTTVYQWLFNLRPEVGEQNVRAILGRMLFSGKDGQKPTATLSGGEVARLMMCKLILLEYNVLLLDEPTNHLDLESISSLKEAIEVFEGTILFVTHDRELASAATRVLAYAGPNELIDYNGPLDEYLEWYDKQKA
ncbi:MAG: ABC-F family ATP-binding cassette domain-containing protein [Proteobacteria bacterium]|nr:ABC-F family ATP-binding cassette domain-containing protein [Pseudomonadota bacterium]